MMTADDLPAVPRSLDHALAEEMLPRLRKRLKALRSQVDALPPGITSDASVRLVREYTSVEGEIALVRHSLIAHRQRYVREVRRAYRPALAAFATRALAALQEAESAIGEINKTRTELRKAGAVLSDLPTAQILVYLTTPLARLAGEKGEST